MSNPSLICSDVEIKGSITFKGVLRFDGILSGGSISGETLVIGEHAEVQANIRANNLTIQGHVSGNVDVAEKTILEPTGSLYGDLETTRFAMSDGATFFGGSKIGPRDKTETHSEPPKALEALKAKPAA